MTGPRGAATAVAIEEAALDLVLEHGYENVTVDLVCEAAGVSQRTFFNHFPTKDDAILGRYVPGIDEGAARRFIVGTGPLLQEALSLISPPVTGGPIARLADRMKAISSAPSLLAGHVARIAVIDDELRELVTLRLGQQQPDLGDDARRAEAEMVTNLLGAIMRWTAVVASREDVDTSFEDLIGQARSTLDAVIRASQPTPSSEADGQ